MRNNINNKIKKLLLVGALTIVFICMSLVSADSNKTSIIQGVGGPIAKVGPDGTYYFIGSDMSDMMIVSNTGKKEYEVIYDDSGNIIREVNKLPEDLNPLVDPDTGLGPDGKDPFVGLRAYLRSGEVREAFYEPIRFAYLFKDAATSDAIAAGAWCKDFVLHPSKHMIHESVSNFYFSTLPAIAEIGPKGIAIGIGGGIVNGLDNYMDNPTAANAKIAWGATKYYFISKALIAGSEFISPPLTGFYGDDIVYGVSKYGPTASGQRVFYGTSKGLAVSEGWSSKPIYTSGKTITDPARILPIPKYENQWHPNFPMTSYVLEEDIQMYRLWGGVSPEVGKWWFTKPIYSDITTWDLERFLSLPSDGEHFMLTIATIPKGTRVQVGIAAPIPKWGGLGGARQLQILENPDYININTNSWKIYHPCGHF